MGQDDHPLRLQYIRAAVTSSLQAETTRVNNEINTNLAEIAYLQGEKDSIRFLKVSNHDRHWILKNENHLTVFHPLTWRNEKIVNNVLPSDSDISRLICTHPESKCLNVPLSTCSLFQHADQTGVSDHNLLQIILMFLKNIFLKLTLQ